MSIIDTFKKLMSNVKSLLNKSVSKTYISNESETTIESLKDSVEIIGKIYNNTALLNDMSSVVRKDKQYITYYKKLHGSPAQEETKTILSSLKTIAEVYIHEVEQLLKYVSFNKDSDNFLEINNVKYSQTTFIGLLEQASIIDRFIKAFIFKSMYYKNDNEFKKDLPWMFKLINEKTDFVANQVNMYNSNYGMRKTSMVERITEFFKSKGYDPTIVIETQANTTHIAMLEENNEVKMFGILGLPFSINIFAWGSRMYMLYAHNRQIEREYERKAMENHVMRLEMDLRNLDPNTPEYQRLEKVISNYHNLIASVAKDIEEYKNS